MLHIRDVSFPSIPGTGSGNLVPHRAKEQRRAGLPLSQSWASWQQERRLRPTQSDASALQLAHWVPWALCRYSYSTYLLLGGTWRCFRFVLHRPCLAPWDTKTKNNKEGEENTSRGGLKCPCVERPPPKDQRAGGHVAPHSQRLTPSSNKTDMCTCTGGCKCLQ